MKKTALLIIVAAIASIAVCMLFIKAASADPCYRDYVVGEGDSRVIHYGIDTDCDGLADAIDPDDDNDTVLDEIDNCRTVSNLDQLDCNYNRIGNACDATMCVRLDIYHTPPTIELALDSDSDGIPDTTDNCDFAPNPRQENIDRDDKGDVCDDSDEDGVYDDEDICRTTADPRQDDFDDDGIGDACDDSDEDGTMDWEDICPADARDECDDGDGDDVDDDVDVCPYRYDPRQLDQDEDGIGDQCDNCKYVSNPDQANSDGDSRGDACESDLDSDGVIDDIDNCKVDDNPDQTDTDEDGKGDACDRSCEGPNCPETPVPGGNPIPPNRGGGSGCSIVAVTDGGSALIGILFVAMAAISLAGIRKKSKLKNQNSKLQCKTQNLT